MNSGGIHLFGLIIGLVEMRWRGFIVTATGYAGMAISRENKIEVGLVTT